MSMRPEKIVCKGILTHCVFGKFPASEFFNSHRRLHQVGTIFVHCGVYRYGV
jgi:hypothetical protein